ncbi:MAG TPA: hypothetical protein VGD65_00020 [Chryseosolibacter sp.]
MKKKILRFSVEALLIVFSILLALWIDNRKESSKDRALKSELYKRLYTDIKTDSINYAGYLKRRDRVANTLTSLIQYVNTKKLDEDSLAVLLSELEYFGAYQAANSTYNSIVSSGQMALFESDTVFLNISRYCISNVSMVGTSDAYMAGANRFLVPFVNEHFDRRLFYDKNNAGSVDLEVFSGVEFINVCYSLADRLIYRDYLVAHAKRQARLLAQLRQLRLDR